MVKLYQITILNAKTPVTFQDIKTMLMKTNIYKPRRNKLLYYK